jgi:RNA methyltransferase, TrmH family
VITSADNPRLRLVRRLESRRQRARLGLFACEGEDLVEAARAAGVEPVDLLVAAGSGAGGADAARPGLPALGGRGESVEPALLAAVSTLAHPPRVIGVFRRDDLPAYERRPVGLALWHVADPGNVGTLIRCADAFGASMALSAGCADPTGPKALRGSAGAIFRVPLGRFDEAAGRRVALVARGGEPLSRVELGEGTVFVLGAERDGLPDDVVGACEAVASIPLAGTAESLNVAVAGAIALYEWSRRA